jgi:sulfite exporter TauE/SafE
MAQSLFKIKSVYLGICVGIAAVIILLVISTLSMAIMQNHFNWNINNLNIGISYVVIGVFSLALGVSYAKNSKAPRKYLTIIGALIIVAAFIFWIVVYTLGI